MAGFDRFSSILRAVALRVVVWGTLTLLVLANVLDLGCPFSPRSPPSGEMPRNEGPESPWPHLRGPRGDGVSPETGLADSWPKEGPPVLWRREIGRGYSGCIAVEGRVYTQAQTRYQQLLLCLDGETGREIWQYVYGWPYEAGGMYPGPRATPTWHQGRVYFAAPEGLVGCVDARNGRLLWSVNVLEKFEGSGVDFGYSCSPLVEDDKVILPVGGPQASVVALDAQTGATVWASGDEPASYSSAISISLRGRRHVVAFLQNSLASFDLTTGRLLWQHKYSEGYDEHATFPLYAEPLLMIARPFTAGSQAYRLEVDEAGEAMAPPKVRARLLWQKPVMSNDTASSVLVDGHVYGFDLSDVQTRPHRDSHGKFRCMKLATGDVLWSSESPGHATLLAADGKLFLFNDKGEALLARASPQGYEELGRVRVFADEICWTAPALERGRLYLRSPTRVACVYVGRTEHLDPGLLAAAQAPEESSAPWLSVSGLLGKEREYPFDAPDLEELARWYGFSLGAIAAAGLLAALVDLAAGWGWPQRSQIVGRLLFWFLTFVSGAISTVAANRFWPEFVFTWPVCLFAGHQVTLIALVGAKRSSRPEKARWMALAAVVLFVGACLGYYALCRRVGMAVAWFFLLGFLPSWPLAVPAAYRLARRGRCWKDALWALACFSAYFWACGAFNLWRAASLSSSGGG